MAEEQKPAQNKALALKEEHVNAIMKKVMGWQKQGELDLPPNYSVGNALNSAWLVLQEVKDKDDRPALEHCTRESIANALLNMVVQGLNVHKSQGYFVVYGKKLVFQRSYFGAVAVLKRVDESVDSVPASVVYEGDNFKYRIKRGVKEVSEHEQAIGNVGKQKIIAAYAEVIDVDGKVKHTEIMTMDEIKQAWKQSKMNPVLDSGDIKATSTHGKFTADMAQRTVINKACKMLINSSDDRNTIASRIKDAFRATDEERAEAEAEVEIQEKANKGPVVDIKEPDENPPVDAEFTEAETKPETEQPKQEKAPF